MNTKKVKKITLLLAMLFVISCSKDNDNNTKIPELTNQVDDERIFGTWYRCWTSMSGNDDPSILFYYEMFVFNEDFTYKFLQATRFVAGYDYVDIDENGTYELKEKILYLSQSSHTEETEFGIDEYGEYFIYNTFCNFTYRRTKCY